MLSFLHLHVAGKIKFKTKLKGFHKRPLELRLIERRKLYMYICTEKCILLFFGFLFQLYIYSPDFAGKRYFN